MNKNLNNDDYKFIVFESVGWANTPDEYTGGWFSDFPHPTKTGSEEPVPRVGFTDWSTGMTSSPNWSVFCVKTAIGFGGEPSHIEAITCISYETVEAEGKSVFPWPGPQCGEFIAPAKRLYVPSLEYVRGFYDESGMFLEAGTHSAGIEKKLQEVVGLLKKEEG